MGDAIAELCGWCYHGQTRDCRILFQGMSFPLDEFLTSLTIFSLTYNLFLAGRHSYLVLSVVRK